MASPKLQSISPYIGQIVSFFATEAANWGKGSIGRQRKECTIKLRAITADCLFAHLEQLLIIAAQKHQLADG